MSLQLILGSSGSGKSHRLYQDVINESVISPKDNFIVIVPEQFTMGTQAKIVQMHPRHGTFNVDIVSFPRLAYKVFEELGIKEKEILDDTGKSLIIRKILEDHKDELTVFKKNIDKPGFVEEIKSAISEMLQYGVSTENLSEVISKNDDRELFSHKLRDLSLVYSTFKRDIREKYIASEEILEVLCKIAPKSDILHDSIITLDGFTGFTPIQYRLIGILLEYCKKVTITLTIDSNERENVTDGISELFYLSKNTIQRLYRLADERHIEVLPPVKMDDKIPVRFGESKELTFLEKNIFRYNDAGFPAKCESIRIYEGNMPKSEIAYVTGEIKRLVAENGYHYRDFAIVSADIETYGELAVNILAQNDIPSFLDYKRNVMGNAAVNFIRSALKIVEEDFSYESVFGFLKTGFVDINQHDIDILDNYCVALGIRGFSKYNSLWIRKTKSMEASGLSMDYINSIREKVVSLLDGLRTAVKSCHTVKDYCMALYEFMVFSDLERKLHIRAEIFAGANDFSRKGEYEQVYGKIIRLLDKFVALLGDEKMDFRQFNDILDAGFSEIKIGLIPQALDAVMIGDIERTRLENIKILFFVGVNDGIIPKHSGDGGLISETDKEIFKESNVELSMTEREKVFVQRFYLYLTMTKASNRLYLTYAKIRPDGNAGKMSYLLTGIRKLFPNLCIYTDESSQSVLRLVKIPKCSMRWKFVEEKIDKDVAEKLYGDDYMTSISAVESYYACAFAHFITYGLRLSQREVYSIKATDIGTLYHDTLERVAYKINKENKSFTTLTDEDRLRIVTESVNEITTDYGNTILYSSKRNEYMITRLITMTDRTVWAVGKQLVKGKFNPTEFEKNFYLADKVRGRIDRIDTYEDEENVYVKVVDYKTGDSDFDLLDTYYGLKIQLVTYMNAAVAMERKKHTDKNIIPAGMFYYNISNPFVDETDDAEKAILDKLRVKGVVNGDGAVVEMLDEDRCGKSLVIPASFNKDGVIKEAGNVLSGEGINLLSGHVDRLIDNSIKEITSGVIHARPYMQDKRTGCDYCSLRSLCGFNQKISECRYNGLQKYSPKEIFEMISKENGGNDNGTGLDQ